MWMMHFGRYGSASVETQVMLQVTSNTGTKDFWVVVHLEGRAGCAMSGEVFLELKL